MDRNAVKNFWSNVVSNTNAQLDERQIPHTPKEEFSWKKLLINIGSGLLAAKGAIMITPVIGLFGVPLLPLATAYVAFRAVYAIAKTTQEIYQASKEQEGGKKIHVLEAAADALQEFRTGFGKAFSAMFNSRANKGNDKDQNFGPTSTPGQKIIYRPSND